MLFNLFLLFSFSLLAQPGYFSPWGKDSDIALVTSPKHPSSSSIGVQIADKIITFHQKVLSPVDGPRSHFRPCSSQYMRHAMRRYGFFKGFIMGCDRLLRENDEEWVYQKVYCGGKIYKYDPAQLNKRKELE